MSYRETILGMYINFITSLSAIIVIFWLYISDCVVSRAIARYISYRLVMLSLLQLLLIFLFGREEYHR